MAREQSIDNYDDNYKVLEDFFLSQFSFLIKIGCGNNFFGKQLQIGISKRFNDKFYITVTYQSKPV